MTSYGMKHAVSSFHARKPCESCHQQTFWSSKSAKTQAKKPQNSPKACTRQRHFARIRGSERTRRSCRNLRGLGPLLLGLVRGCGRSPQLLKAVVLNCFGGSKGSLGPR